MDKRILNSNSVKTTIGGRLLEARGNMKRKELCEKLNRCTIFHPGKEISEDVLKMWELGRNAINIEWIPAICHVLHCDVGYLFGEYEGKTREKTDVSLALNLNLFAADTLFSLARDTTHREFIEDLLLSPAELYRITIAYQAYKEALSCEQLGLMGVRPDDMVVGQANRPILAAEADVEKDFALYRLQKAIIRFAERGK